MKTTYKLIILLSVLLFAHVTRAQTNDTIPEFPIVENKNGFIETNYPFLCVKYNAKENVSHIYCVYPHKMWVSVNGSTAVKMGRRDVIDVKAEHFTAIVTRKKYKQTYKF